ncbi:hypothetical protein PR048_009911 [Dryococelus australis]|uniref:Uncharacterized protein n=1 Tax=Dryococelus australis TaxID=614101 RepID=A0ABQ9I191_9NEOP|nr:hypothetical protein PR048_009911 [Dryococelus australis]
MTVASRSRSRNRRGATVAERLACSPPTKANRAQSPAWSLDFRKWESCRTMPLVVGFSRESPVSPTPSFRHHSIFTSITLNGSQDLAVKSRPNRFAHSKPIIINLRLSSSMTPRKLPEMDRARDTHQNSSGPKAGNTRHRETPGRARGACRMFPALENPSCLALSTMSYCFYWARWRSCDTPDSHSRVHGFETRPGHPNFGFPEITQIHYFRPRLIPTPYLVETRHFAGATDARCSSITRQRLYGQGVAILAALNSEVLRAGMKERLKREITEKTRGPAASSGTIPTCENPAASRLGNPVRLGGMRASEPLIYRGPFEQQKNSGPMKSPDGLRPLKLSNGTCITLVRRELTELWASPRNVFSSHALSSGDPRLVTDGERPITPSASQRSGTTTSKQQRSDIGQHEAERVFFPCATSLQGRSRMGVFDRQQLRNEGAGEMGDPRENPPDQLHRRTRFPLAKIREWLGRGLNTVRLGGRFCICSRAVLLTFLLYRDCGPRGPGVRSRRSMSAVCADIYVEVHRRPRIQYTITMKRAVFAGDRRPFLLYRDCGP